MNKVMAVMTACFVMAVSTGYAQQQMRRTPQERAQKQVQWMQKNLGLSEAQNVKAYEVILHFANRVDEIKTNEYGKEKRMDVRDLQQEKEAGLKSVLTADQFDRYMAHEQEMKERMN